MALPVNLTLVMTGWGALNHVRSKPMKLGLTYMDYKNSAKNINAHIMKDSCAATKMSIRLYIHSYIRSQTAWPDQKIRGPARRVSAGTLLAGSGVKLLAKLYALEPVGAPEVTKYAPFSNMSPTEHQFQGSSPLVPMRLVFQDSSPLVSMRLVTCQE